jgi:hypothetical protein
MVEIGGTSEKLQPRRVNGLAVEKVEFFFDFFLVL